MRILVPVLAGVFLAVACSPGTPVLDMTSEPAVFTDTSASARVRVVGTMGDGTAGKGTVALTTAAGTLDPETVTLDTYGTATATVSCDLTADAGCAKSFEVSGTWNANGTTVTGFARVNLKPTNTVITPTDDFADAGCPVFILRGPVGPPTVTPTALRFDASNARFTLWNSFIGTQPGDFRQFDPGRGVLITVDQPPNYVESRAWNVFLFHSAPNTSGTFSLGTYSPVNEDDGTGTRIRGPETTCAGFVGDTYVIRSIEYGAGGVTHLSAELWAHCPDPLKQGFNSRAHGYICY